MMTKNAAFAMAGKRGNRHTLRVPKPQAVSEWTYPLSLGTMTLLASAYIENVAKNSTC